MPRKKMAINPNHFFTGKLEKPIDYKKLSVQEHNKLNSELKSKINQCCI